MLVEDILKLKREMESFHGRRIANQREYVKYYHREYKIKKHKGIEAYKPGTPANKIAEASDHIASLGMRVEVPPWGKSQKIIEAAGRIQRFDENWWQQVPRGAAIPQFRAAIKDTLLMGMHVFKLIGDVEGYPTEPETLGLKGEKRKQAELEFEEAQARAFPFVLRVPNPMNVLPEPTGRPSFVIEKRGRTAWEVKQMWPEYADQVPSVSDSASLEWWEWWTEEEFCYFIGEQPFGKGVQANPFGFLSYTIGYSGYGEESEDGAPERLSVGLLDTALGAFKAQARNRTARLELLELGVYGHLTVDMPPGEDFAVASDLGQVSVMPQLKYNPRHVMPPPIHPEALRIDDMLSQDIHDSTVQPVMGGGDIREPSGYARALKEGNARVRLEGPVSSLEASAAAVTEHVHCLIKDYIKGRVSAWWFRSPEPSSESVGPEDFKTYPMVVVKMDGKSDDAREQMFMMGLRALAAHALSWETVCRDFFMKDPADERLKMDIEAALADPGVIAQDVAIAAQIYGIEREKTALEAQTKLMAKEPLQVVPQATQTPQVVSQAWQAPQVQEGRKLQRLGPLGRPRVLGSRAEQMPPVPLGVGQ